MLAFLPMALRLLPWGIALCGLIFGLVERSSYYSEKAARAGDQAAAEKAVNDFRAADAQRTAQLENAHAQEISLLKEQLNARNLAIAQAAPSSACVGSPPMRTLFDSLRQRDPAGSGAKNRTR